MAVITIKKRKTGQCFITLPGEQFKSPPLIIKMEECFLTPKLGPSPATQENVECDQEGKGRTSPADWENKVWNNNRKNLQTAFLQHTCGQILQWDHLCLVIIKTERKQLRHWMRNPSFQRSILSYTSQVLTLMQWWTVTSNPNENIYKSESEISRNTILFTHA